MKRFGLIAAIHVALVGVVYFIQASGGSEAPPPGQAIAGANGIVTWSNQQEGAAEPTVRPDGFAPFDERAANLQGYNAGDGGRPTLVSANEPRQGSGAAASGGEERYEPRRPSGEASPSASRPGPEAGRQGNRYDDSVLQPEIDRTRPAAGPRERFEPPSSTLPPFISYTVAPGDSLWALANRFGTTVSAITAANPGIKANAIQVGQVLNIPRRGDTAAPAGRSPAAPTSTPPTTVDGSKYTVRSGDSLSSIAASQGTTVSALKEANELTGNTILIGQELVIPDAKPQSDLAGQQHRGLKVVVESGDTIIDIAKRHGVSYRDLMRYNQIEDARRVRIGQVLLIPDSGADVQSQRPSQGQRQAAGQTQQSRPESGERPSPEPEREAPRQQEPARTLPFDDSDSILFEDEAIDQPVIPIEE